MLRYSMLFYGGLCYSKLSYAVLFHPFSFLLSCMMLSYAILSCIMLQHTIISYYYVFYNVKLCFVMAYQGMLHHAISQSVMLHGIVLYQLCYPTCTVLCHFTRLCYAILCSMLLYCSLFYPILVYGGPFFSMVFQHQVIVCYGILCHAPFLRFIFSMVFVSLCCIVLHHVILVWFQPALCFSCLAISLCIMYHIMTYPILFGFRPDTFLIQFHCIVLCFVFTYQLIPHHVVLYHILL